MKHYIQYKTAPVSEEQAAIWIAMFSSFGFDGFEEQEGILVATGEMGIAEEEALQAWLAAENIVAERKLVEEQNWNALWEQSYAPVVVEGFAGIRASFHAPLTHVAHELVITPKMSFGTGHHATTRLMIGMMQHLPVAGAQVFDFGTGTGVLAILAEKLGAKAVEAIDNDIWSIENARENCVNNGCSRIAIRMEDSPAAAAAADIILANINRHIIIAHFATLAALLKPNGYLVLSGLLAADREEIHGIADGHGLALYSNAESDGWICLVYRHKG